VAKGWQYETDSGTGGGVPLYNSVERPFSLFN
jgi:hypothetical protein